MSIFLLKEICSFQQLFWKIFSMHPLIAFIFISNICVLFSFLIDIEEIFPSELCCSFGDAL